MVLLYTLEEVNVVKVFMVKFFLWNLDDVKSKTVNYILRYKSSGLNLAYRPY